MIFNQLQQQLQTIYEIETTHNVSDFIISNKIIGASLTENEFRQNETVFVCKQDNCLDIAVYLDHDVINNLSTPDNNQHNLNDYCYALEGISHFLYLVFNGAYERSVTLLELEIQAEIDKFVMLLHKNYSNDNFCDDYKLHQSLFDDIYFRKTLNSAELIRYKDANFYAGKYCSGLLKQYRLEPEWKTMNQELRRFYRLPLQEKIHRINQLH